MLPTLKGSTKKGSVSFPRKLFIFIIITVVTLLGIYRVTSFHDKKQGNLPPLQQQEKKPLDCSQCPIPAVRDCPKVSEPYLEGCRSYKHRPYVANLLETSQFLRYTNYSLTRFADGEFRLLVGDDIPCQQNSPELQNKLEVALTEKVPFLSVGIADVFACYSELNTGYVPYYANSSWRDYLEPRLRMDTQYLTAHITSPRWHTKDTHYVLLPLVFDNLRETWKNKNLVILRGDNKQVYTYDVYDTAKSQTVLFAPRYQAWSAYAELKQLLMSQDKDALFIVAAGPVSKVLVYDLAKSGRRALDMGHLAKDYDGYMLNKIDPKFFMD